MKKVVIANWGSSRQGKSDTVKKVAKLILKHYPKALVEPSSIDFSADINIIITIGDIKIGIESVGDPGSRLFASLKAFVKAKCDVIICSTRTSGATVEAVNDLYRLHGYDNIWVTNYRSNEKNQLQLNDLSAKHIYELLQNLIAKKI